VSPLSPGAAPDPREKCFAADVPPDQDPTAGRTATIGDGSLEKSAIKRVIQAHLAEVKWCYDIRLASGATAQGRIVYRFIILPDGTVSRSVMASTTMNDPEVETCIGRAFCRWTFPLPSPAGIVIVTYPFSLTYEGAPDAGTP
jgi:hypothetical protein